MFEIKLKVVQDRIDSDDHSEILLNLEKSAQLDLNNALKVCF
jgi:hypothetical protein